MNVNTGALDGGRRRSSYKGGERSSPEDYWRSRGWCVHYMEGHCKFSKDKCKWKHPNGKGKCPEPSSKGKRAKGGEGRTQGPGKTGRR